MYKALCWVITVYLLASKIAWIWVVIFLFHIRGTIGSKSLKACLMQFYPLCRNTIPMKVLLSYDCSIFNILRTFHIVFQNFSIFCSYKCSSFPTSSQYLLSLFSHIAILRGRRWYIVILICFAPMISDNEELSRVCKSQCRSECCGTAG